MRIERHKNYFIHFPGKSTREATCINLFPADMKPDADAVKKYYENPPEKVLAQALKACRRDRWIFQFCGTNHYAIIPDTSRNSDFISEVW